MTRYSFETYKREQIRAAWLSPFHTDETLRVKYYDDYEEYCDEHGYYSDSSVAHYRALNLNKDTNNYRKIIKGVCTQGTFEGINGIIKKIIDRGLDSGETVRIEVEENDNWIFVTDIVIPK